MFSHAILGDYQKTSKLVALCDVNQTRMDYHNRQFTEQFKNKPIPTYRAWEFDKMLAEQKPDAVIVTTIDRTHHEYIIRALEAGCDAITEKPMTTDAEKCRAILEAVERTGKNLRVTFNYRYSPARSTVKELLMKGTIGEVKSVHFEWLLDTTHGADYFRRWHRDKRNSGGLMVHKATHHFDLVNWWLDFRPANCFRAGRLEVLRSRQCPKRAACETFIRAGTHEKAKDDPFALNLQDKGSLQGLYYDAEHEDAYLRDQNVFGDGISIEDTMNVLVRYKNGAQMSYSLTAYSPWEGYRIAFNGTKGRHRTGRIGELVCQRRRRRDRRIIEPFAKDHRLSALGKALHRRATARDWRTRWRRQTFAGRPFRQIEIRSAPSRRRTFGRRAFDSHRHRGQPVVCDRRNCKCGRFGEVVKSAAVLLLGGFRSISTKERASFPRKRE